MHATLCHAMFPFADAFRSYSIKFLAMEYYRRFHVASFLSLCCFILPRTSRQRLSILFSRFLMANILFAFQALAIERLLILHIEYYCKMTSYWGSATYYIVHILIANTCDNYFLYLKLRLLFTPFHASISHTSSIFPPLCLLPLPEPRAVMAAYYY